MDVDAPLVQEEVPHPGHGNNLRPRGTSNGMADDEDRHDMVRQEAAHRDGESNHGYNLILKCPNDDGQLHCGITETVLAQYSTCEVRGTEGRSI